MALDQTMLDAPTILRTIEEHSDKLYELGARKLGLFGSFVRGEQTPDSDIDILVTMATPDYFAFCDVKFFIEDLFQRPVDMGDEDWLREEIRRYVMKEIVYVPLPITPTDQFNEI